jgi:hypothetical protein
VIDGGLDRLHEVVEAKLGGHPVLAELIEEAETAGDADGISDLTRQRIELELSAAARRDDAFGQAVMELAERIRKAEQAAGRPVITAPGSAVFTGSAQAQADGSGIAIGQAGVVRINQAPPDPQ